MTTLAAFFFGLILGGPLGYGMACLMFVIVNDDYDKRRSLRRMKRIEYVVPILP